LEPLSFRSFFDGWFKESARKDLPSRAAGAEMAASTKTGEVAMRFEGGCYCGAVRHVAGGDPMMQAQCHCRECQYISGGAPNTFIAMPAAGFSYTKGQPKQFTRKDLERAVTREFCSECGTHLVTKVPGLPAVVIKVGTMDEPAQFQPKMAIYTCDKQAFHQIPAGVTTFEKLPGR
jgi:hypothetical protein